MSFRRRVNIYLDRKVGRFLDRRHLAYFTFLFGGVTIAVAATGHGDPALTWWMILAVTLAALDLLLDLSKERRSRANASLERRFGRRLDARHGASLVMLAGGVTIGVAATGHGDPVLTWWTIVLTILAGVRLLLELYARRRPGAATRARRP